MMGVSDSRTLVLVGRTGNGKSATGNSILGDMRFPLGGTTTSKLETTVLKDGQVLNVIDTPGFFDSSIDRGAIEEIIRCMKLAVDGIHAVLVVFTIFTVSYEEDLTAISRLQQLFGRKICDYMIVVFTDGDQLEKYGTTLENFFYNCRQSLKEIFCLCGNRVVLFDNKSNDETKKANQVQTLLSHVNTVLEKNGGEPFANGILTEVMKTWTEEHQEPAEFFKVTERYFQQEMLKLIEKICVEHLNPKIDMMETVLMIIEENAETAIKKAAKDIAMLKKDVDSLTKRLEAIDPSARPH